MAPTILKALSLLTLTSMAAANQCPVVQIKESEICYGLTSECWSPGEPDIDCPDNGICCFDGCINVCGLPPVPSPEPETPCTTDYVTQTEDVPEEMCHEIPGMETCTTISTTDCSEECDWVDHPEIVTESTTCCENVKKLRCEDLQCNPDAGTDEVVSVEQTVCKKRQKVCYNVPEQDCHDEQVQDCKDLESQKCHTFKKPTEWPTTTQSCTTEYREKCSIINREVCNLHPKFQPKFPKLRHFLFKGKKQHFHQGRQMCRSRPEKVCRNEPYTKCNNVTTITIEYEDVEECHPITETVCVNKNVSKCEYVDKEQCNEAEDICETNNFQKTVFVRKNCDYADKKCHFVDVPECEEKNREVEKFVPKLVCRNVCVPVVKNDCQVDEPTRDCRTVFKTMSYKVPVLKC